MGNVSNITSSNPGSDGVFYRAPLGTRLPVDAVEDLDPAFVDQGIVGEEGVKQAITRDTEDVKDYGGTPVYTLQTEYGEEVVLTVYESTNVPTLRTVFGDDNVIKTATGFTVLHNKARLPRSSMVWEHLIDQGVKRQVAEHAQVISVGEIQNVHTDIVKYELTIKLYPDADGNVLAEHYALDEMAPLQIVSAVLVKGTVGKPYSARLIAAGGDEPYTFSTTGSLPAGLSLAAGTGVISGTPTAAGKTTVTVKVADAAGATAQRELELTIQAAS